MSKRLIQQFRLLDTRYLSNALFLTVNEIEDAMIECGLTPGVDYTKLDLFELATTIVAQNKDGRWTFDD